MIWLLTSSFHLFITDQKLPSLPSYRHPLTQLPKNGFILLFCPDFSEGLAILLLEIIVFGKAIPTVRAYYVTSRDDSDSRSESFPRYNILWYFLYSFFQEIAILPAKRWSEDAVRWGVSRKANTIDAITPFGNI